MAKNLKEFVPDEWVKWLGKVERNEKGLIQGMYYYETETGWRGYAEEKETMDGYEKEVNECREKWEEMRRLKEKGFTYCECGEVVRTKDIARHKKRRLHQAWLEEREH